MTSRRKLLIGVAIALTWPGIQVLAQQRGGGAQQPPPQRAFVQVAQIKPEMVDAFQNLVKTETIPALKKAGVPWLQTYAIGPFGQAFTTVALTPIANYAQFDEPSPIVKALGPAGAAAYNAKLRPMLVRAEALVQTFRQDLSITSNSTTPPPFVLVQTFQLLPGKGGDFANVMTQDFLPAYKKAGVKDLLVYVTNFGGPGGQFLVVQPLAKMAELDQGNPLQRAGLSQEALQQMNARRNAFISGNQTEVARFLPELSYGSAAAPPSR